MSRSVIAVLAGLLMASTLIASGEFARHQLYPRPSAMSTDDFEATKAEAERNRRRLKQASNLVSQARYQDGFFQLLAIVSDVPVREFLITLLFWSVGTVAGTWVAAQVARRSRTAHALIVGTMILAAGVASMLMADHPLWFWLPRVGIVLPAAYAGARLPSLRRQSASPCPSTP